MSPLVVVTMTTVLDQCLTLCSAAVSCQLLQLGLGLSGNFGSWKRGEQGE